MCRVCGSTFGHKRGCPEADITPERIGTCEICGEPIYDDGDDGYFNVDGDKYHYDCFKDEYLVR